MLNLPVPDDQRFEEMVAEAKKRIPRLCAEWTDFNDHDPGVTLVELFAWYQQMQRFHLGQVTAGHVRMFLKLMGVAPRPIRETRANLRLDGGELAGPLARGQRLYSEGGVAFELERELFAERIGLRHARAAGPDGFHDITGLLLHWRVLYTLTPEDVLYLGLDLPRGLLEWTLWFEIGDVHPVKRNRPAGADDPPPRAVLFELLDGGRASPLQVLRDGTFALSFSGGVTLRASEPPRASDAGLGLPECCWLRLRVTDAGCEENPGLLGIAADYGSLLQRRTRSETEEFTLPPGGEASVEVYSFLASKGETDLFVRDRLGWYEPPKREEAVERGGLPGRRFVFSAGGLDDDGAPNVRVVCMEGGFRAAVRQELTGLPFQRLELLDGRERLATGALRVMCARGPSDGPARYRDWRLVDTLEEAGPADPVYTCEDGVLCFGDNLHGAVPEGGTAYLAGFALTDGAGGTLPEGQALLLPGAKPGEAFPAGTAFHVEPGRDAEMPEDAAQRLRESWRGAFRAATARDYERIALQTPGRRIGRVKAAPRYDPENSFSPSAENTLTLIAVPYSGRPRPMPDERFLDCVARWMERFRTVCTRVVVAAPVYIPLRVRAEVISRREGPEAEREARERLEAYLAREEALGEPVPQSGLVGALGAAEGVLGVKRLAISAGGAQCRHNEQGDVLIPRHGIPYLDRLELHVSQR